MFEHRHKPFLSTNAFLLRLAKWVAAAILIVFVSLGLGAIGYRHFESMSWLDATLNAAMILTGMGPIGEYKTAGGKVFATMYALYSGVVFLTVVGMTLAPLAHRMLHYFHLEDEADPDHTSEV